MDFEANLCLLLLGILVLQVMVVDVFLMEVVGPEISDVVVVHVAPAVGVGEFVLDHQWVVQSGEKKTAWHSKKWRILDILHAGYSSCKQV